jgi:regulator of protease activity HflC (stomatin/prohibitin superfamily)
MVHVPSMVQRLATLVGLALAAFCSTGCYTFASVGSGELAVVHTPDGVQKSALQPGDYHLGYWDTVTNYSVRSQEREEQLDVLASDGLRIVLDTSIRFHPIAADVVAIDREFGRDYYAVLIGPTLRSQARRVVGRFRPEEIYSTQRELIERQIREGVDTAIKGRHVELEAVLIRNVTLPAPIQAAINDKLEKEQAALKMKYVEEEQKAQDRVKLMQARDQAEQQKIAAESAAEVSRIAAQAAADAKKIEGAGLAEYQKLVQSTITEQILRLRQIEATKAFADSPNTKLVLGTGGVHPLLDLRGAAAASPYP